MKLKCRIHGKDYDIVSGATFSEEYNETLDSGSIIIDHIPFIEDLKPYDDVYIWNSDEEFSGYRNIGDMLSFNEEGAEASIAFSQPSGTAYEERKGTLGSAKDALDNILLAGSIIDVWAYELLGEGKNGALYELDAIPLKLTVSTPGLADSSFSAYYDMPSSHSDFDESRKLMRLRLRQDLSSGAFPPSLWVSYSWPGSEYSSSALEQGSLTINPLGIAYLNDKPVDEPVSSSSTFSGTISADDMTVSAVEDGFEVVGHMELPTYAMDVTSVSSSSINVSDLKDREGNAFSFDRLTIYYDKKERKIRFVGYTTAYSSILVFQDMTGEVSFVCSYSRGVGYWNIDSINTTEKAPYTYKENASAPTMSMTVNGLTRSDLLHIDADTLPLNAMVKGRSLTMHITEISDNADGTIGFTFSGTLGSKSRWAYIRFVLSQDGEDKKKWASGKIDAIVSYYDGNAIPDEEYPSETYNYRYSIVSLDDSLAWFETRTKTLLPRFFKHLLVDRYDSEMIDLGKNDYKYVISLMSETKRLEKTVLPNLTITQPIAKGAKKRTTFQYMKQYLDLYSPKIKKKIGDGRWEYVNKYKLDLRDADEVDESDPLTGKPLKAIFSDDVYAPEMSFTSPTLKDVFSQLMEIKDCIPIVRNDVIYAMKISDTHGKFEADPKHINFVYGSNDSSNYSTALRVNHQGSISQNGISHCVEYMGFRTTSGSLLTIGNLEVITRYPIYKINKMYLCYYKKVKIYNKYTHTSYDKAILVKQDISSLVLQREVWDALPADWTKYPTEIEKFEDMQKYKLLTVKYDIGSNYISGWGTQFSYYAGLLKKASITHTYIECMMGIITGFYPYGIYGKQFLEEGEMIDPDYKDTEWYTNVIHYKWDKTKKPGDDVNVTLKVKSMFFEVDYDAMFTGSVIHTKDGVEDDDLQTIDNASSALTILESDGIFKKAKANRLANPTMSWTGRYDDFDQMNNYNNILGSVFEDGGQSGIIVYHREYQIYDDCVLCNFVGSKDYVLKNYYTSVFARHRTYSYASYYQSVARSENDRFNLLFSLDSQYYEADAMNDVSLLRSVVGAFSESEASFLGINKPSQVNGAFVRFSDGNEYMVDCHSFSSGYSLCFSAAMYDALTSGIYISSFNCFEQEKIDSDWSDSDKYIGSAQSWYMNPVDSNVDAFMKGFGFYFGHFDYDSLYPTSSKDTDGEVLLGDILNLPIKNEGLESSFTFGKYHDFCKDDKEVIDYTMQFEFAGNGGGDVSFSEWIAKLSSFGRYGKFSKDTDVPMASEDRIGLSMFFGSVLKTEYVESDAQKRRIFYPGIVARFSDDDIKDPANLIGRRVSISVEQYEDKGQFSQAFDTADGKGSLLCYRFESISAADSQKIVFKATVSVRAKDDAYDSGNAASVIRVAEEELTFERLETPGADGCTDYYFVGNDKRGFHRGQYFPTDTGDGWNAYLDGLFNSVEYQYGAYQKVFITYPQTMYVLVSDKKLNENPLSGQLDPDSLPDGIEISSVKIYDVFSEVRTDDQGRPYIGFTAAEGLGKDYKSVQYWYLDDNIANKASGSKGDGLLHFVFGINRTPEQGDAKIYLSCISSRRKEVYDSFHNVCGYIANTATDEYASTYGEGKQTFKED